jgi:hypothetical protein
MKITKCDTCSSTSERGSYIGQHKFKVADLTATHFKWQEKELDLCHECFEVLTTAIAKCIRERKNRCST